MKAKLLFLLIASLMMSGSIFGQVQNSNRIPPPRPPVMEEEEIFIKLDDPVLFPGCEIHNTVKEQKECTQKKLQQAIFHFMELPDSALQAGLIGNIKLSLLIEKNGAISTIKIEKSLDELPDQKVLEAAEKLNTAGIYFVIHFRGRPVKFLMFVDLEFTEEVYKKLREP